MVHPKTQSRRTVHKAIIETVIVELHHLPDRAQQRSLMGAADHLLGAVASAIEQGHNPEAIRAMLADRGIHIHSLL